MTRIVSVPESVVMGRPKTRNRLSRKVPTEREEQIHFVIWLKKQGFRVHHSPNGGKRNIIEGYNLKMMGVSRGFPDIFVCIKSGHYSSFFVEMKPLKGGKVEEGQIEWLEHLRAQGFYAEVARGAEEAKRLFLHFLSFSPTAA